MPFRETANMLREKLLSQLTVYPHTDTVTLSRHEALEIAALLKHLVERQDVVDNLIDLTRTSKSDPNKML